MGNSSRNYLEADEITSSFRKHLNLYIENKFERYDTDVSHRLHRHYCKCFIFYFTAIITDFIFIIVNVLFFYFTAIITGFKFQSIARNLTFTPGLRDNRTYEFRAHADLFCADVSFDLQWK